MEDYKVGILGTGFGRSVQIPGFQKTNGFTVEAVYGRNKTKNKQIEKEYSIKKSYTRWDDIIEDPEIDVVSIVSPVYLHYDHVINAIDKGKDILCEKPMAMNVEEAYTMWSLLEKNELVGMINHEFRQYPERQYFNHLVRSGALGEITDIKIDMASGGRLDNSTRNWTWWSDAAHGGGLWGALGSHLIDFIHWTFGSIEYITGKLQTHTTHLNDEINKQSRLVTSDDSFWSMFQLENGTMGTLNGSTVKHGQGGTKIAAYGTKASLKIGIDRQLYIATDNDRWEVKKIPKKYQLRDLIEGEGVIHAAFEKLLDSFLEGINTRKSPSPSFEDGLYTQYVLDGLKKASSNRKWVNVLDFSY